MPVDREHKNRVTAFVKRAKTPVSEGDVVAGSGLHVDAVRAALYDLMRAYSCAMDVHGDGTLVYDFGNRLQPLREQSLGDRIYGLSRWLWRGFSYIYKASLAVVLVVYAVVFVVLIVAAAIAASAASEDSGPAEGAFHIVAAVFRGIFEFSAYSSLTYMDTDRHGYPYRRLEPKGPVLPQRRPKPHSKSFVASVYDFVLGPQRVEVDARAQQREVASFVRKNGGALSVADVQALSGMNRSRAEHFFARFVAEFDGSAEISEGGALYAQFPELMRSKSREHDEPIVYYWDEYEAPYLLTGNTTGKNIAIAMLAAFNLICSFLVVLYYGGAASLMVWLGLIPAFLFFLFFAIPALRLPFIWWQNRRQHQHNIRKRLWHALMTSKQEQMTLEELIDTANAQASSEEKLDAAQIRPLLEETTHQAGASLEMDSDARLVVNLERLRQEMLAQKQHRLERSQQGVVFSTRDGPTV